MRPTSPLLLLAVVLACHCNASVTTDSRRPSGPAVTPAPPPAATPAAAVKPPRPTNKAGCDACKGLWAIHGISETESCICKTKDAGKSCRDGTECEGTCIVAEGAKFEVVVPGPPPRGFYTGRCSDYDATFGCHKSIANGTRAKGPVIAEEAVQHLCVD